MAVQRSGHHGAAESRAARQIRARKILRILKQCYPDSRCALHYRNPLQLLIATMLSAQCTDKRVNMVTPVLFDKYRSAEDFAGARLEDVETMIRSTGFYHHKAKHILSCCRDIVEKHAGKVPKSMEALCALAGVGRKTANVVLGNAFGVPGVAVDTHMVRIHNLLGLTRSRNPDRIERDLMALLPEKEWVMYTHRVIAHGRRICIARRPKCEACRLKALCPSARPAEA